MVFEGSEKRCSVHIGTCVYVIFSNPFVSFFAFFSFLYAYTIK